MRQFCVILSVMLLGSYASPALAGDCGCAGAAGCACSDPCHGCAAASCCGKRCELQIGTKKVKVTCYDCECEDVCLPGPSRKKCTHRENVCNECGECDCCCGHAKGPHFVWSEWCPNPCAKVTNVKRLVKREVEKEVPDYKWVVVDCCAGAAGEVKASDGGDMPPPPPVPTPASTTTKRAPITKPAPAGARVGESYPLTDAEIKHIENQIQQASHVAPAARVAAKPAVTPVKAAPVKARTAAPAAVKSEVPWSLFSN